MPSEPPVSRLPAFLRDAGECGALVAAIDWQATPLGPIGQWPQSLRLAVGMVLRSPAAMALQWGPEGILIYNDAYAPIAGSRHPAALGSEARKSWPEIAEFNEHVVREGLAGRSLTFVDQPLTVERNGIAEQAWFTLDYSPVLDEDERPAGVLAVVIETTDKMRAQTESREESARNRQILDSAVDYAIIAVDLDGRVTRWNEGARRVLGWTEAEMLGQDASKIFTPEDRTHRRLEREELQALAVGMGNDERWHVRKSGERFWASGELTPIHDEQGRVTGFVKVLRDRTEQHQAAEALRQSEERLRRAQSAGGVGTFTVDLATNTVSGTDEFFSIYGILSGPGPVPVPLIEALVLSEDASITSKTPGDSQPVALEVEYRIRRANDDSLCWIARKAEFEFDEQGRAVRLHGVVQDITGRKLAQSALEESEAQFRTFAQALPNHVWTSPASGLLDWFNDRVYEYSGLGFAELRGQGWARLVHPEDLILAGREWTSALASGQNYETEFRVRRHDGIYRWHLVRAVPIRTADGSLSRWVGTNTDIHERKLAEAQTRSDRDRIWMLSQELMLICDLSGVIVAVNPASERLLGWREDEMVGARLSDFVHPDDVEITSHEVAKLGTGTPTLAFENRYRAKTGGYRLLNWTAIPDGGFLHGVARDVTEERNAAAERERIWGSTNDLMATASRDGTLRSVNPAWTRLLGHSKQDLVSRPLLELTDTEGQVLLKQVIDQVNAGQPVKELELAMLDKAGGKSWVAWAVDAVGEILYMVGRNVTEQRSAEDALRQALKMEAVGQLTGGIAHDFNNLLQGITGSLSLIKKLIDRGRAAEVDRYIGNAMNSAKRAAALTHRLLAFSRRQPLDPRPVEANPLVTSMEDLLRRTLGEQVELKMQLAGSLWLTRCDPNQLENAILNLAINSRDAMPHGGMLVIETANAIVDPQMAAKRMGIEPGRYVCLSVTDTGAGMSAETVHRAFEPFFTTKPIGQGTGLGLSMIYGFARQSGGYAQIYSELGKGTTVRIYLPQHRGPAHEEEPLPETGEAHSAVAEETVLIVEDEAVVRELIVAVLSELGYQTLEAADGPSGLAVLQGQRRIDLLITDVGLPGLNGRQLADAARIARPAMKVLFMTGYAENATMAAGFLEPGMAMITKPFAMESMASKIRDVLGA